MQPMWKIVQPSNHRLAYEGLLEEVDALAIIVLVSVMLNYSKIIYTINLHNSS